MKLNQECIRDLLLVVEDTLELNSSMIALELTKLPKTKKYSNDDLAYTVQKLEEAKYLKISKQYFPDPLESLVIEDITWEGHKFLDTIRDDAVWKQTKSIVSKFSSVSVSIVENVASKVLTNLIEKQMGLF